MYTSYHTRLTKINQIEKKSESAHFMCRTRPISIVSDFPKR